MKKLFAILMSIALLIGSIVFSTDNKVEASENEVRAAWISTVFNIDWPSKGSRGNAEVQKREYINLINRLKGAGINTVVVQVRPESDAIYRSKINPWSRFLTGTQGKDPGYDPLDFIIRESHNRGLKVHAWFNPYRASIYSDISNTSPSNYLNIHRDWVVNFNGKWYYDPGLPQVRKYIVDTVTEVVNNYDIDGVHFDDYFYPGAGFNDSKSYAKYGSGDKSAWRRENVNTMIREVHDSVREINPNVVFGVSPAGIWRNKRNDPRGSNTGGNESYSSHYADTRYWIKNGLVDYVVPQVYWRIGHPVADYETLVKWWSEQVRGTNVDLYIGQGIYKNGQSEYGGENVAAQIKRQIQINRKYPDVKGSIYFSAKDIVNISQVYNDLKSLYLNNQGNQNSGNQGNQPSKPGVRLPYQNQMSGRNRAETAVKISQKSWKNKADSVVLVNGEELLNAVASSTLASKMDAPILLKFGGKISNSTINEIKRLKAKKLIIVGDKKSITEVDSRRITSMISGITVDRINSSNPQIVSNAIAKRLDGASTAYIASEEALVDALSISAKAGKERAPIIISSKNNISNENINYLKNNNIKNIYFIGGTIVLSDNVIKKIENSLGINLNGKRIYGSNRIETNSKVIEDFYKEKFSSKAFVTRSDAPIDAITVSVFAQKNNSPIILAGNSVSQYQRNILEPRAVSLLYKVGGNINQNSYSIIHRLLGGEMK